MKNNKKTIASFNSIICTFVINDKCKQVVVLNKEYFLNPDLKQGVERAPNKMLYVKYKNMTKAQQIEAHIKEYADYLGAKDYSYEVVYD